MDSTPRAKPSGSLRRTRFVGPVNLLRMTLPISQATPTRPRQIQPPRRRCRPLDLSPLPRASHTRQLYPDPQPAGKTMAMT